MATPVKSSDISKKELMEAYSKLKMRTKRANEIAKKEGEAMMNDLLTVASAGLMGYYIGGEVKKARASGKYVKKAAQIGGIDVDLIVGGGTLAAGMMKWGGKFSPTLSSIGAGVLAGYASRRGQAMGDK